MDPFLYQYSIGGVVFGAGLYFGFKQGYLGFRGRQLWSLLGLLAGLFAIMGLQAWLQYADMPEAAAVAYEGEPYVREQLGAPVDYAIMVGYFLAMLLIGTWFGKGNKSTKDFFFGGQRFSWWLIAFSMVATTIGSYSFVKYSKIAYGYGTASSQTYLNDWLWAPLLIFGWLPLLYFSRIVSIPEYFERRFGRRQRVVSTWLLLLYLIGYVGINLFTMGQALHILLGWNILYAAMLVAAISAVYVTFGGQTSVIMTDLFQGAMLMATGLVLLLLGVAYMGGFGEFWQHLPRGHRTAFPPFNADPTYPAVGIFWQDGMANTAMFYFLNQGMVMRLLAARSVRDSRKAVATVFIVLMPIAAVVVASGGWVARALVHAGLLDPTVEGKEAFFVAADMLAVPGVFGLIMAALTAALMSTVDTLITAIAAIAVNDIYQPSHPDASDADLLKVARISSVSITLLGVALVPIFMTFGSIYSAHGAFTAAVTPPLVVALLLGVFWRRFTPAAALATMVGGSFAIFLSILFPEIIAPLAHGVPMQEAGDGFLPGKDQYKFMRALFGLLACAVIGVSVTFVTKPRSLDAVKGLVWGTVSDAIAWYKGSAGIEDESAWASATAVSGTSEDRQGRGNLLPVRLAPDLAEALGAAEGALVYVSDPRAWLGGLRSAHAHVVGVSDELPAGGVELGPTLLEQLGMGGTGASLRIKRMY